MNLPGAKSKDLKGTLWSNMSCLEINAESARVLEDRRHPILTVALRRMG